MPIKGKEMSERYCTQLTHQPNYQNQNYTQTDSESAKKKKKQSLVFPPERQSGLHKY